MSRERGWIGDRVCPVGGRLALILVGVCAGWLSAGWLVRGGARTSLTSSPRHPDLATVTAMHPRKHHRLRRPLLALRFPSLRHPILALPSDPASRLRLDLASPCRPWAIHRVVRLPFLPSRHRSVLRPYTILTRLPATSGCRPLLGILTNTIFSGPVYRMQSV